MLVAASLMCCACYELCDSAVEHAVTCQWGLICAVHAVTREWLCCCCSVPKGWQPDEEQSTAVQEVKKKVSTTQGRWQSLLCIITCLPGCIYLCFFMRASPCLMVQLVGWLVGWLSVHVTSVC